MAYNGGSPLAQSTTSATPASSWLASMDAFITAVTGWTKVSSAIVVGTNTWNVYKSAAANNSQGADFYVALGYPTATPTSLLMTTFEGWNTGTLLATNYPPNTTTIPSAVTFVNPGAALALPSTGTTMGYLQTPALVTTGFSWGISVLPDVLKIWALSSTNNIGHYIGLYDSMMSSTDDPFPLVCMTLGVSASANGGTAGAAPAAQSGLATREPATTTSNAGNFTCGASGASGSAWTINTGTNDTYTGKPYNSRVLLRGRGGSAFRGLLKDTIIGPTQTNNGDLDTYTINAVSKTAVRCGTSSLGIYFEQL